MSDEVTYDFGGSVDAATAETLTGAAREIGLPAEAAPKFAEYYAKQQTAASEAQKAAIEAAAKVPESYTFEKVGDAEIGEEDAKELSGFAKEIGLTQAQAQKFAAYELRARSEAAKANAEMLVEVKKGWNEEVKADKDIGGDKLDENLAKAKTALERFFPDVAKNHAAFPILDHPSVVKGLVNLGKLIGPDGDFVKGGTSSPAADPAKVMFPDMA